MRFWVAGGLVPAEQATVAVLDHGFTVGDGVFETLKTVADPCGRRRAVRHGPSPCSPVALCRGMGIDGLDADEARDALLAVCAANPELAGGGRLRVTLTSGPGPLGSDRTAAAASLVVVASPAIAWAPSTTLALSPWPRNERSPLVGLKSTSYAENVLALARAKSLGAQEALLTNLAGEVCEGTGSNVFVVIDGTITTPPLSGGCLAGITRALVIEWCHDAGIEVHQRAISLEELAGAEEIFITSSTRDVHPVETMLDDQGQRWWAAGRTPQTEVAAEVFATRSAAQWNP